MTKKNPLFILLAVLSLFIISCEEEVDLFSDEEDVAVIYALLDQTDSVQYFRINPTFIGEGDARELAGDTNLTNYPSSTIEVRLYDLTLGENVYYTATETQEVKLNPNGIFNENIRMYRLSTPLKDTVVFGQPQRINTVVVPDHEYKLWVYNGVSKKTYTSTISIGNINDLTLAAPVYSTDPRFRANWLAFYDDVNGYSEYEFIINAIEGGERYRLDMVYHYYTGQDTTNVDSIVYQIGETELAAGASRVSFNFDGYLFYTKINNELEPFNVNDSSTLRSGEYVDLIVTVMGQDLNNYIEIAEVTVSGLSQERPEYSNIDNGIGVFSFQSSIRFNNILIDFESAGEVVNGPLTQDRIRCARAGSSGQSIGVIRCYNP